MENFKIGGKIILEDNVSYRILDILCFNGIKYLFCCTEIKPITSKVFFCKEKNGEIFVSEEKDVTVLEGISRKIVENM